MTAILSSLLVGALLTASITLIIPSFKGKASANDAPIGVVATIFPVADILSQLMGDAAHVVTLLPPGASPHTYEPRPADVRAAAGASLFVSVGAGLDEWAGHIARVADRRVSALVLAEKVTEAGVGRRVGAGADHDHHDHHGIDPHFWLDPVIVRDVIAPALADALIELAPLHRAAISSRLAAFQERLTELDGWIRERLAPIDNRKFIGYHDAWQYFAHRYGLEQVAAVAPFPGQEPSARWMADLISKARAHQTGVVLAEPQLNPQAAQTIAGELKGTVIVLDPIGGPFIDGRESYIDMMRYNTEMLARALGS